MNRRVGWTALGAALAALCIGQAPANEPVAPTASPATSEPSAPPADPAVATQAATFLVPVLTEVDLVVLEPLSSKTAVSGQPVRLALAAPLAVAEGLGLPAGTPVEGVVIHAAKGGMGGKSGELLIGARRILVPGGPAIPLRSFKLGPARGRNNETLAFATAVAVGFPALFITGGSAVVPANMIAHAKTSSPVELPRSALAAIPPANAGATPTEGKQP